MTQAGAAVGNYPFTTIEPNTGVVPVPDSRLDRLPPPFRPPPGRPATGTLPGIAGRGEGGVDPVRDIDVLELELQLADLETVTKRLERTEKSARLQKEKEPEMIALLHRVQEHLDQGKPVRTMPLTLEEQSMLREFWLLTGKPLMVVVNVAEAAAGEPVPHEIVQRAALAGGDAIAVSARIENDIAELDAAHRAPFLHDLGLEEPGLYRVARSAYRLLRLITFFTAGDTEVRAWNLREGGAGLGAAA